MSFHSTPVPVQKCAGAVFKTTTQINLYMKQEDKIALQKFNKYLNNPPKQADVRVNKAANNTKYLPISFLEMELDELMFGQWGTSNFHYSVIGNEVAGKITLWFIHPVTGLRIEREGAAATMIRCKKDTIPSFESKIANALGMDIPHLKTDCIRNAISSLGKRFGRDLNREHTDIFQGLIPETVEQVAIEANTQSESLLEQLQQCTTQDEVNTLFNSLKMTGVTLSADMYQTFINYRSKLNDKS